MGVSASAIIGADEARDLGKDLGEHLTLAEPSLHRLGASRGRGMVEGTAGHHERAKLRVVQLRNRSSGCKRCSHSRRSSEVRGGMGR